jgi:colicin import membrane protein
MKKLFPFLLLLVTYSAFSQPTEAGTGQSLDIEAEHSRIQTERARQATRYEQEEAACYARFAVTDCLRKVHVRRRESLADLRRQEILLNEAERKRKTLEQMKRLQEKSSVQRFEQEATKR